MSGYAASARIERASPRLARPGQAVESTGWLPPNATAAAEIVVVDGAVAALPLTAGGPAVSERIAAVRERWSQLTFFLFDANSWRS